uniref:Uncharacterized protein n=1 Tax=Anguilla anguilla TaxID=7936 RepID=A0A0E9Q9K0_ANGAN
MHILNRNYVRIITLIVITHKHILTHTACHCWIGPKRK